MCNINFYSFNNLKYNTICTLIGNKPRPSSPAKCYLKQKKTRATKRQKKNWPKLLVTQKYSRVYDAQKELIK